MPRRAAPTGQVEITVGGKKYAGTLERGTAKIAVGTLPRGFHPISATYGGDGAISPTAGIGLILVR